MMKSFTSRLLLVALFAVSFTAVQAQVLYSEDFENGMGNITLIDNDGLTPAANVAAYSAAWTAANPTFSNGTNCAISNSWYSPAGTADDWMILPGVAIQAGAQLEWEAKAQDANYPDGYEVWASVGSTVNDMLLGQMIFSVGAEATTFTAHSVDLSAYAGQTINIAFRNNSTDMFLLLVDNIQVRIPLNNDVSLQTVEAEEYVLAGNLNISGEIKNEGVQSVTSMDITYVVDNGTPVTETISGISLATNGTYQYNFSTPANLAAGGHTIDVTVTNINGGGADDDTSNDTQSIFVSALSSIPNKKVILADHTGAWCQFCPDGTVVMNNILANPNIGDNTIGLAVHNGDAMAFTEGEALNTAYVSGFPSGSIDFFKFDGETEVGVNRGTWESRVSERQNAIVPASVSLSNVTWDASTRVIGFKVNAQFVGDVQGDYRMNAYIVENGVTGTGSGYDQVNYYNTQSGHPYFGAGNPVVGFVHDHTLRAMLGGAWGVSGSVPTSVTNGSTVSYDFTYTLPASMDHTQIQLVGVLQKGNDNDAEDRYILNSAKGTLVDWVNSTPVFDEVAAVKVFPNPAQDYVNLELNLENSAEVTVDIVNMQGQIIDNINAGFMTQGINTLTWGIQGNIPNGMYLMRIQVGESSIVKKVSVFK